MAWLRVNSQKLTDIADEIRLLTHDTAKLSLDEIPNTIQRIWAVADNAGYESGYQKGKTDGIAEGYEQGKQEATENLPVGYVKVDPTWTNFSHLCDGRRFSLGTNLKYSDTANGKNFTQTFYGWDTGGPYVIPSLDVRKGTTFTNMFNWSSNIEEIGEMDISNATDIRYMFGYCSGLRRVFFAKCCIKLSISFAHSALIEEDARQSIVDGLADLTGQTAQTLTLHPDVGAKLTDEQKATITAKNWTLVY